MGNNSIFDDIGIGASDLGLSPDPDKIAQEQREAAQAAEAARQTEKKAAEDQAVAEQGAQIKELAQDRRSRTQTVLTGSAGLDDEELTTSRKTLLGS